MLFAFSVLLVVSGGMWGLRVMRTMCRAEQQKKRTVYKAESVDCAPHYSHYLDGGKDPKSVSYWSF